MNNFYLYIIKCSDDYLYTGITNIIIKRLKEHRAGMSKITKNRQPIKLAYKELFKTRIEATKKEKEIKGWLRSKKEALINNSLR